MLLFILANVFADPPAADIPLDIRAFYKRQDDDRERMVERSQGEVSRLEGALRNDPQNANLKLEFQQAERNLAHNKAAPLYCYFLRAVVGEINCIHPGVVAAILDEQTAVIKTENSSAKAIVVTDFDTKNLQVGKRFDSRLRWRIKSLSTEDPRLLLIIKPITPIEYYVVTPFPDSELEKYRPLYDAEKKLKAEQEATSGIPKNFRQYFQRAEITKAEIIRAQSTQIGDLEVEIRGEPLLENKSALRLRLRESQHALQQTKKSKPFDWIPAPTSVGDIGMIPPAVVRAVIDDDTAVIEVQSGTLATALIVLTNIHTKDIKARQQFASPQAWTVTSLTTKDDKLLRVLNTTVMSEYPSRPLNYYVVSPIKPSEIEKFRKLYVAEKNAPSSVTP